MMDVCDNQSLDGSCETLTVWQDSNKAMRLVNEVINRGPVMFRDNI
jgi:hypothetical protein